MVKLNNIYRGAPSGLYIDDRTFLQRLSERDIGYARQQRGQACKRLNRPAEGFDTFDLKETKALLEGLAA